MWLSDAILIGKKEIKLQLVQFPYFKTYEESFEIYIILLYLWITSVSAQGELPLTLGTTDIKQQPFKIAF